MPIKAFTECLSGKLQQCSKNKFWTPEGALKAWSALFNQHLKDYGLPESYVSYVSRMQKATDCYSKGYNGKRWMLLKARIYEAEANEILKGEGEKIEKTCAKISKFMGFPVKATVCTVTEFYNYLAVIQNGD